MTPKEQFIEAANIMCGYTREDLATELRDFKQKLRQGEIFYHLLLVWDVFELNRLVLLL